MKDLFYISIFSLVIFAGACTPIENLPPEPIIEFRSFSVYDTVDILGNDAKAGRLTFYFEDGDGDLGYDAPDGDPLDPSSNLFLKLYRRTDGEFVLVTPTDPLYPSEYRIPFMLAPGQTRILRGTIDLTLIYFLYNPEDTLYYDFWVRDRAGHDSNTDSTCVFILGENGTCIPGGSDFKPDK